MSSNVLPSYRKRGDRNLAVVTLTDERTNVRRDYYLGTYDSPESREMYLRILAEWVANGRRLPAMPRQPQAPHQEQTISQMALAYWQHCEIYYQSQEAQCIKSVLRLLKQFFGQTPAGDFGPKKLRFLRDHMVAGNMKAETPRQPWSRKYVNHQVERLRRMFKWAAGQEMLPSPSLSNCRRSSRSNAGVQPLAKIRPSSRSPWKWLMPPAPF